MMNDGTEIYVGKRGRCRHGVPHTHTHDEFICMILPFRPIDFFSRLSNWRLIPIRDII